MRYTYSDAGKLKEEKDITANEVIKTYSEGYFDVLENQRFTCTFEILNSDNGNTVTTKTVYDPLGRIYSVETTDAAGTVLYREEYGYTSDTTHRITTKTIKGETTADDLTEKQYTDKYGNMVKTERIYTKDGEEVIETSQYTYDYLGNLTAESTPRAVAEEWTDSIYTMQYEYDVDGQITKATDIYGNFSTNEYDGLGRLVRSADAVSTASQQPYYTTYTYDAMGRMLTEPNGDVHFLVLF